MAGCNGQDWASYQSATQSTTGLAFVFVKRTEGLGYINPNGAAQVAHVRAGGLVVGHYHYPKMTNSAAAEANRFLSVAQPQSGDVLALDWEGYDAANKGVPWSQMVAYKKAFIARLRATAPTHQHLVYCSPDYLSRDPGGEYGDGLWIATGGKAAGQPGIAHKWLFHQYSTAGGIDHDYTPMTSAQLKTWAHAKEDDMLTAADYKGIAKEVAAELTAAGPRDTLAGAFMYWLLRAHDPSLPLPTGKDAPSVAGSVAALRPLLASGPAPQLSSDQIGQLAAALSATLGANVVDQLVARLQS